MAFQWLLRVPHVISAHQGITCPRFPPTGVVTLPIPYLPVLRAPVPFPGKTKGAVSPSMVGQVISLMSHLVLKH